jgi:hypothetical protein
MRLTYRRARKGDFDEFHRAFFMYARDNQALRADLEREWNVFHANAMTQSMIVDDIDRAIGRRMVGIAQMAFVTDGLVKFLMSDPTPYAKVHASRVLPDGSWPLVTEERARIANSGCGLNVLATRWEWEVERSTVDERRSVREYLAARFALFYEGYNFNRLIMESIGREGLTLALNSGFRLLTDYSKHWRGSPNDHLHDNQPYLSIALREESAAQEGTFVSHYFSYRQPHLHLKPHECELLWLALLGIPDFRAAGELFITPDAVKKRWDSIYARVQDSAPEILPEGRDDDKPVRGTAKRDILLRYLREHLEEIRPTVNLAAGR